MAPRGRHRCSEARLTAGRCFRSAACGQGGHNASGGPGKAGRSHIPPLHRGNGGRDGRRRPPVSFNFTRPARRRLCARAGATACQRWRRAADYPGDDLEATLERVSAIRQALADPATLLGSRAALTGGTEAPSASAAGESSFAAKLEQASAGYRASGEAASLPGLADAADSSGALAPSGASVLGTGQPHRRGRRRLGLSPPGLDGVAGVDGITGVDGVAGSSALSPADAGYQGSPGARIVAIAESQLGQTEQPPGSNESPAIAQYRSATAGAEPGRALVRVLRLVGGAPGGRADRRTGSGRGCGLGGVVVGAEHRTRDRQWPGRGAEAGRSDRVRRRARRDRQRRAAQTARSRRSRATTKTRSRPTCAAPPKRRATSNMS